MLGGVQRRTRIINCNRTSWCVRDDDNQVVTVCEGVSEFNRPPHRCLSCWCPAGRLPSWPPLWLPPPSAGCRWSRSSCCSVCRPGRPAAWSPGRSSVDLGGVDTGKREKGGEKTENVRGVQRAGGSGWRSDKSGKIEAQGRVFLCVGLADGGFFTFSQKPL